MSAFIYKSLSVLFFVLMSVCIKATGDNLPLFEVVFFRNLFALIPLIVVIYYLNLKISSINNYKLHFFRGLVGISAMSLFFISLRYVPLIEMQTISFSSVFFISILSIFFLVTALIYSSVGFGGGSTYLALLLIWGVPYTIFPLIALACNIIVVSGNSFNYIRAGNFNLKLLLPK